MDGICRQPIKRTADLLLAGALLCITAPLMLLIALLIACDGQGRVVFRQKRQGLGGREFLIFKFRSMRIAPIETDVPQATRNDPRVTTLGKWLRRFSIDELPQLINVVKGEMSLVGPRPHAVSHNRYYEPFIPRYAMRHRVKPGITGLAQVKGWRGETETLQKMQRRVTHDLYYIEHWSLWLDFKILAMTVVAVLRPRNAY